jgi:hypothetical protein
MRAHWVLHDLRRAFPMARMRLNAHAFTIAHLVKRSTISSATLSHAPPIRA